MHVANGSLRWKKSRALLRRAAVATTPTIIRAGIGLASISTRISIPHTFAWYKV
jgi:hypothetical protein